MYVDGAARDGSVGSITQSEGERRPATAAAKQVAESIWSGAAIAVP